MEKEAEIDPIQAVVVEVCPGDPLKKQGCVRGHRVSLGTASGKSGACSVCGGTGLRWPSLSRAVRCPGATYQSSHRWPCKDGMLQWYPYDHRKEGGEVPCPTCKGVPPGRQPDVTLEKINSIVHDMGLEIRYYREPANLIGPTPQRQWADIGDDDRCWNRKGAGFGETDREAACAALLATI